MSENIPQTSASERVEVARKALAVFDDQPSQRYGDGYWEAFDVAEALRALITPPAVGESEDEIAANATEKLWQVWDHTDFAEVQGIILGAVRIGIQSAHESWEPADRPTQEQMLTWLGIEHEEYDDAGPMLSIRQQYIEKEEV